LNNIVEQDHRFIKWRIQQDLGYKDFESARRTLAGIEIIHMIKKKGSVAYVKKLPFFINYVASTKNCFV